MPMKQAFAMLAVMLVIPAASAFSQPTTTISYDGAVTAASGPHAARFSAGDQVVVSYTLNPSVADTNGDPLAGHFLSAVLSLSVSFPGIGISAVAGAAGPALTLNNFLSSGTLSDRVFFFGGPISSASLLNGEPIDFVEVQFLSDHLVFPEEPTMLSSDALPLSYLIANDVFVILHTGSGSTFVHFQPRASQIASLVTSIQTMIATGALTPGQANGLIRPLENALRSLARGHGNSACSQLYDFEQGVDQKVLDGAITAQDGAALIESVRRIRTDLGC
jgi:hypothetical protein